MIERRNFYRILHVQPDASMAVIRENYRVLMQKLKIHPELSDSNWNESLLDIAYDTLLDPYKRAAYDHELLLRYHIRTLSHGAFGLNLDIELDTQQTDNTAKLNQRNLYRILQVQPDAPMTAIQASYQVLKKDLQQDPALLDAAFRILSNPKARKHYDELFAMSNFSRASGKTSEANIEPAECRGVDGAFLSEMDCYQAVITDYCFFCKTPYPTQTNAYLSESCLECASPLAALHSENFVSSRRVSTRTTVRGEFVFYLFWPGAPYQGSFQDLSPTGIRFLTQQAIDVHDIIKIDAPNLKAVAEVTRIHTEGRETCAGTRFITVKFDSHRGNFVTVQA